MNPHFRDLDDHEEGVRIAVRALDDMRNGAARSDGPMTLPSSSVAFKSLSLPTQPPLSPSASPSAMASSSTSPPTAEASTPTNSPGLVSWLSQIQHINQLDQFRADNWTSFSNYRSPSISSTERPPSPIRIDTAPVVPE